MLHLFGNGGLFACGCCKKILLSDLAKGWGLAVRRVLAKASDDRQEQMDSQSSSKVACLHLGSRLARVRPKSQFKPPTWQFASKLPTYLLDKILPRHPFHRQALTIPMAHIGMLHINTTCSSTIFSVSQLPSIYFV